MKRLLTALMLLFAVVMSSCSNSTGGGVIGPGGNISFAISGQSDPNNANNFIFGFKPSVDTKLSKVIVGLPAQPFFDTLTSNNVNYIFSKDTIYTLNPYTGVQTGQAWTFAFTGNTVSNNQAYTTTSNFTIP